MPFSCVNCGGNANLKRPKSNETLCKNCFFELFENEIHHLILESKLLEKYKYIAIAASGGKDSTVLLHVLDLLNKRHKYGVNFILMSIDEGISGYRDESLMTVEKNAKDYSIPLHVFSYKDLYGWSMDQIVEKIGQHHNCTFCGVFRRQALDRGASLLGVDCIVTGHNADDTAETVLMNILRGDAARLQRCTNIITENSDSIPRAKPLQLCLEREIVLYAYFKHLYYFSIECTYSTNAFRRYSRNFLTQLVQLYPTAILNIIKSGRTLMVKSDISLPIQQNCKQCGYPSSQNHCKACQLLQSLNKGKPKIIIHETVNE